MAERLKPEVRRARILSTAMAIIDTEGHQGLTMRGLARACGMTAPGLMHYFADMSTLVVAVVDHRDYRDTADLKIPPPGPGATRRILGDIVDNIVARPKAAELFAIVEAQAIDPRHPGHGYFRERAERLVDNFHAHFAAEFAHPRDLAMALFAIMDGLQLNWLRDREAFDLRERWDLVADAVFAAAQPA